MPPLNNDELSAEELAYLQSGGKSELPVSPAEPAAQPQAEPQAPVHPTDGAPAPQAEDGAGEPPETTEDEEDAFEIRVGKDGKQRIVGKDGKFVSHRALHSEREKRKGVQKELEAERLKFAKAEERMAILNEFINGGGQPQVQQPQAAKSPMDEEPIDPAKDFIGSVEQMRRQQAWLADQHKTTQQATQQRDAFTQVTNAYHQDAAALMQAEPAFKDAYLHLVNMRHKELEFAGIADKRQRDVTIAQEEAALVVQALQQGKRPAVMVYELAKLRGFVPAAAPAPAANGGAAPSAPAANGKTPAQQQVERLKAGQQVSQTLSGAGTSSHEGLTAASLAAMTDEEFSRTVDGMSKSQLARFMGQ